MRLAISASSALHKTRRRGPQARTIKPIAPQGASAAFDHQHEGNGRWCARYTEQYRTVNYGDAARVYHSPAHGTTTSVSYCKPLRNASLLCSVFIYFSPSLLSFSPLHISPQRHSALAGLVANCQLGVRKNRFRGQFSAGSCLSLSFFHSNEG